MSDKDTIQIKRSKTLTDDSTDNKPDHQDEASREHSTEEDQMRQVMIDEAKKDRT